MHTLLWIDLGEFILYFCFCERSSWFFVSTSGFDYLGSIVGWDNEYFCIPICGFNSYNTVFYVIMNRVYLQIALWFFSIRLWFGLVDFGTMCVFRGFYLSLESNWVLCWLNRVLIFNPLDCNIYKSILHY